MRHWKKKPWVDSEVRNWDYIADHLAPDATSADAGKVLTVGETGKPEWGEGGGSGGGIVVLGCNNDEILTYQGNVLHREQFENLYNNSEIVFFKLLVEATYGVYGVGYVCNYSTSDNSIVVVYINELTQIIMQSFVYVSEDDHWVKSS